MVSEFQKETMLRILSPFFDFALTNLLLFWKTRNKEKRRMFGSRAETKEDTNKTSSLITITVAFKRKIFGVVKEKLGEFKR